MLEPTHRLINIARRRGVAYTFFVDAGMLCAMRRHEPQAPDLLRQRELIAAQLRLLKGEGHSIQLHIHPHWEDTRYIGDQWAVDVSRYRLNQFIAADVMRIVSDYRSELKSIVGDGIHVFRAGGWCIQPFSHIATALSVNCIDMDSTLFRAGHMATATHQFDFRGMPTQKSWRFEDDPLVPAIGGRFTEIPISTTYYSRMFYLSMVFHRLAKTPRYRFIGDGSAVGGGRFNTIKMMLNGGYGVVTLDGFRVQRLLASYEALGKSSHSSNFVVIAHPKALCDKSFAVLDLLAERYRHNFSVL